MKQGMISLSYSIYYLFIFTEFGKQINQRVKVSDIFGLELFILS